MLSAKPALIILAWGNVSRGDDCAGPVIAQKLYALKHSELLVIEDIQLNVEHVLDLQADVPVLFIDASNQITDGFKLEALSAIADHSMSTHSISPQALLMLYENTLKKPAPPAYLLHISGLEFELGQAVSAHSQRGIDLAWKFLSDLLQQPSHQWQSKLELACATNKITKPCEGEAQHA